MIRVEATLARSVLLSGFTLASGEEVRLRLDVWHHEAEGIFTVEAFNFSLLVTEIQSEGKVVVCHSNQWIFDDYCSGLLASSKCRTLLEAIDSSLALLNQQFYSISPDP